ncbi:hypothetical protein HPB50_020850 [Hyalomma asiaticum]|uniref:Uncharacterized protein n=1 Tax=Hyalomma asiaticum TaxID=266040 RepID=A0ACB7RXY7_HYAAI|nr:hypothetical protein HPB50_020850 [Hyalomma asiaticum]
MSQARLGQAPRRGSDVVVLVSASHTRLCGPAAAEHELRHGSAAAIATAPSSRRRSSFVMAQLSQSPALAEEAEEQDFQCDMSVSLDEESRAPVVRLLHHAPRSYVEVVDGEAHSSRHSVSQQHAIVSRSPSPLSRPSSPFNRPPTPIARPSSPKFRVMSPQQAARLSSYRATAARHPDCRYAAQKRSRSGSRSFGRSLPSSRPQSGTALVKIMEDCRLCARKSRMANEQRRTEATDIAATGSAIVPCGSSAAAAIVAAAASAAGIQLEANGADIEPCLDCLEEFVRRKRVEKGEVSATSVETLDKVNEGAKSQRPSPPPPASPASDRRDAIMTTVSGRVSTTDITVYKRPGSRNTPTGPACEGASPVNSGCTSPAVHQGTAPSSLQSPAPYRCPVCNACKCCGTVPPNCKT